MRYTENSITIQFKYSNLMLHNYFYFNIMLEEGY